ncbi:MAG TPA: DUF202 domain-containing protein [Fibrobacteria bacterium]|nr:DUF202 domain-containing protein [Fibrobacteria bacterium]
MNPDLGRHLDMATRLALERTGLAHERTLMGWVRTCFSIIGFGLTIFTFFLTLKGHQLAGSLPNQAKTMCLALTAGGTLFMALAVVQYYLSLKRLFDTGMERHFSLPAFSAALVCGAGVLGFWVILTEA